MSVAVSHFPAEHLLCRQLTIGSDHYQISVRPVIKAAIPEASHTLTEAYARNPLLCWCAGPIESTKCDTLLYTLFKFFINTCTLQSRDFALQVDGCKGVLLWSNRPQAPWPRTLGTVRLARLIGWQAAVRASLKILPACDKMRRKIMADYNCYITISFLGVLPHEQNKGLGSALLQHLLVKADTANYPIYVEVSNPRSVRFLERFAFHVRGTISIPAAEAPPIILLVRDPVTLSEPKPLRIRPGRRDSDNSLA